LDWMITVIIWPSMRKNLKINKGRFPSKGNNLALRPEFPLVKTWMAKIRVVANLDGDTRLLHNKCSLILKRNKSEITDA
jgi:hypothetical protein